MNKAAGMDQIPTTFLREAADVLAYPISKLINFSVKLSVSLAKPKPLFRKAF